MRFFLLLPLALFGLACHNTNPEKGSGGNKVDKHTTLSSKAIVDSAKSILNQKQALKGELDAGRITATDYSEKEKSLMTTYQVLYQSLAPADTLEIATYRSKIETSGSKDSTTTNKTARWE